MKGYLNYGCVERNSRAYRKALRQCRKNKKRFGVACLPFFIVINH